MVARFILISAALVSANAFAADAPKTVARPSDQHQPAPPQVVLASAEVPGDSVATPAPAPPKRPRVARVTTCRCGGEDVDEQAPSGQ